MSEFDILRSEIREIREMNIQLQDRFDRQLKEHREYTDAQLNDRFDRQFVELKSLILGRPVNTEATPMVIKSPVPIEPFTVRERDEIRLSDNFDEEPPEDKRDYHAKDQRRLSQSWSNAVVMQKAIEANQGNVQYAKKVPDTSRIYLGSLNEREIVEWESSWDELLAAHPTYPFNIPLSVSSYVRDKCISSNDIVGGIHEFNRAGLPQLLRWICKLIRPVSNLMFLEKLENNVYFRSKKDFVLTEKNLKDFHINVKVFAREFTFLLDLLADSLNDGQEIPPLAAKENSIWSVFLKKIPCDYGYASAIEMENYKHKLKSFAELRDKFLEISKAHCGLSEGTTKLSYVVSYRKNKMGDKNRLPNFQRKTEGDYRMRYGDSDRKKSEEREQNRLSMFYGNQESRGYSEDYYPRDYSEDTEREDAAYYAKSSDIQDIEYEYHGEDSEGDQYQKPSSVARNASSVDTEVGDESEEEHRLQAFMQDQNRFGPSPSFPSNRFQPKAGVSTPLRKPPPPPGTGICFRMRDHGVCEDFKLGRCTFNHSKEAIHADCLRLVEEAKKKEERWRSVSDSKPRA